MTVTAASSPASGTSAQSVKVAVSEGTEYVVLRKNGLAWQEDGPKQRARSASEAVKQSAELRNETDTEAAGTYIAIPLRSFNPITVTPQTVTTLKLEEAK